MKKDIILIHVLPLQTNKFHYRYSIFVILWKIVCVCLITGDLLSGLGAAWKVADISEGSTVVIFGLGTVGLSVSIRICNIHDLQYLPKAFVGKLSNFNHWWLFYDKVAQGAKIRGASRIIGVDTNPEKSEKGIRCSFFLPILELFG